MADLRIPTASVPDARTPAPARVDAATAAQRAFFQAALNNAAAPPTRSPPSSAAKPDAEAPVQRLPRPGSLLDIKV